MGTKTSSTGSHAAFGHPSSTPSQVAVRVVYPTMFPVAHCPKAMNLDERCQERSPRDDIQAGVFIGVLSGTLCRVCLLQFFAGRDLRVRHKILGANSSRKTKYGNRPAFSRTEITRAAHAQTSSNNFAPSIYQRPLHQTKRDLAGSCRPR